MKEPLLDDMENQEPQLYKAARRRVRERQKFFKNFCSWIVVCGFLFGMNIFQDGRISWAWWAFFGWGIGVAMHFLETFVWGATVRGTLEEQVEKEVQKMQTRKAPSSKMVGEQTPTSEEALDLDEMPRRKEPALNQPERRWKDTDLV